jgi:hypothetical protein
MNAKFENLSPGQLAKCGERGEDSSKKIAECQVPLLGERDLG